MTGYRKVQHQVPADDLLCLKPEKLGRYYHKVPIYIKELAGKYPKALSDYFLSTYRINSDLLEVVVHETQQPDPQCRYMTAIGKIGFSIQRPLLSELLESYYGGSTPLPRTSRRSVRRNTACVRGWVSMSRPFAPAS